MRFKILLLLAGSVLSACGAVKSDNAADENVIGQRLDSVTPLRSSDGTQKNTVAVYDPVIKKVHQFDLTDMSLQRTLAVLNVTEKHYVLESDGSRYLVDLSLKHISIFDENGNAQHNPIFLQGKPVSAAFRPDLGWLVVYDDLQSVGVIKLSPSGEVLQARVFGAVVDGARSIVSGDLQDDGSLVLGLSDSSIAIVDLQASMNSSPQRWVTTVYATTLKKINWIAPVPHRVGRLLIKTTDQVLLYDLSTQTVIQDLSVDSNQVVKLSKSLDPHVVVSDSTTSMKLIYSDGNTLQGRSFTLRGYVNSVLNSDLDLQNDNWTYVYLKNSTGYSWFNDLNQKTDDRQLVRYRLSDQLALQNKPVVNQAQLKLTHNFMFALYPSVLGYAKKISIMDDSETSISKFNLKKY